MSCEAKRNISKLLFLKTYTLINIAREKTELSFQYPRENDMTEFDFAVVVLWLSHAWLFAIPWTVLCQAPLSTGFPRQEYWSGLPLPSPGESSWPRDWTHAFCVSCSDRQILQHWATCEAQGLFQHQGLFQWVLSSQQVAKVFSFRISLSNKHSGLIFFRIDWVDLLTVQGTLKNLLQHQVTQLERSWPRLWVSESCV